MAFSQFAALERRVTNAIDGLYGELTRVVPRAAGQYTSGAADATRTPVEVVGIADFNPISLIAQDTGKYDGIRPAVEGDKIHVSYDMDQFPNWRPRQNDHIWLIARTPVIKLTVTRLDPDELGRAVCVCVRIDT